MGRKRPRKGDGEATSALSLSDALRSVLERFDEAEVDRLRGSENAALVGTEEARRGAPRGEVGHAEVMETCRMVQEVEAQGKLEEVEHMLLENFVKLLGETLLRANRDAQAIKQLELSEAVLTVANAGNDAGIEQTILSQEVLETVIQICRTHMMDSLFPSIDGGFAAKMSGVKVTSAKKARKRGRPALAKSKRKRRKGSKASRNDHDDDDDDDDDDDYHDGRAEEDAENEEEEEEEEKVGLDDSALPTSACIQLSTSLCRVLLRINHTLVHVPNLEDELLLQLSGLCVSSFSVDAKRKVSLASHLMQIQQACIDLLRSVFRYQRQHREFVAEEIIDSIAKLPRSSRSLRTYHVGEEGKIGRAHV
jgi:hypothetical protein